RLFPDKDLTEFDPMIAELDKFEQIRYPDNLLKNKVNIGFTIGRGDRVIESTQPANLVRNYQITIGDVDAFLARLIRLCRVEPSPYFNFLSEEGEEILLKYNEAAEARWVGR